MKTMTKPNYGLDAPGLLRMFFAAGLGCGIGLVLTIIMFPQTFLWLKIILGSVALYLLGMGCLMVYDSKVTKIAARDRVLAMVPWRGDEEVLDVGCGRGLMLVGAAQRLTTGTAIGIDIWQAADQSANSPEGALTNAQIENVLDRVAVQTADMRKLPFADQAFDVVVSAWAVHNLKEKRDREQALDEMFRVLKAGGHIILSDIEHRDAYAMQLKQLGLGDVRVLFSPWRDKILNMVSFGSYRPSEIIGRKPF